jgi:acetyltransferase-like isoleucine patch superfamily enzyme
MFGAVQMKLSEIVAGFSKRRSYICDETAKLYESAKIVNNFGDVNSIRIGAFTHVKGELLTFGHGGKIKIGDYCYIGEDTRIWSALSVSIGDRVLISHNVNIFDNITHPINPKLRHAQFKEIISSGHPKSIDLKELPVVIQDDVLIGCMSVILRGVTIGEGAIIGAGSIVKKDVPAHTIAEGNPARIVREIPENER